jgi:CrcB protein
MSADAPPPDAAPRRGHDARGRPPSVLRFPDVSAIVHGRRIGRSNKHWAFVFAGGAVGAGARAVAEKAVPTDPGEFPWPTLAINLIGVFVLVWTATRLAQHPRPRERAFLISGFCGGLTTFATMQLELVELIDHGDGWIALGYGAASIVAGLLVARGAFLLADRTAVAA